jgi:hypothetical protein
MLKNRLQKVTAAIAMLIVLSTFALAVQTPLTTQVLKQNNYAVVAGDLTLTFTAMDASNGNSFFATGREVLIVQNSDASPHTFTVTSVADSLGRTDATLTSYSVAANGFAIIQFRSLLGWIQPGGQTVNMTTSSALLKIAVVQYN